MRTKFPGPLVMEKLKEKRASLVGQTVKLPACKLDTRVQSLGRKDPLEKGMATHSSTLAWKFHGWRNLIGYSLWGHKSQT